MDSRLVGICAKGLAASVGHAPGTSDPGCGDDPFFSTCESMPSATPSWPRLKCSRTAGGVRSSLQGMTASLLAWPPLLRRENRRVHYIAAAHAVVASTGAGGCLYAADAA